MESGLKGNSEGKTPPRKSTRRQANYIIIKLTAMICSGVECIRKAQEERQCITLVTRVTKFHVQ